MRVVFENMQFPKLHSRDKGKRMFLILFISKWKCLNIEKTVMQKVLVHLPKFYRATTKSS